MEDQYEYTGNPVARKHMYDTEERQQKADKIVAVLEDYFADCRDLSLLDIACSTGIMSSVFADHFGKVAAIDIDEEAVRTESRDAALRSVKRYLLLEAVAEREGIEVADEDREERIKSISEHSNIDVDRLKEALQTSGQLGRMDSELLEEKALDHLVEVAKIEDVEEVTES